MRQFVSSARQLWNVLHHLFARVHLRSRIQEPSANVLACTHPSQHMKCEQAAWMLTQVRTSHLAGGAGDCGNGSKERKDAEQRAPLISARTDMTCVTSAPHSRSSLVSPSISVSALALGGRSNACPGDGSPSLGFYSDAAQSCPDALALLHICQICISGSTVVPRCFRCLLSWWTQGPCALCYSVPCFPRLPSAT
ncbi:hypothetical protein OBBRIDRAFT_610784 [Obba rivulosa]|uniref:Uncharacterized protein n=1 Tax=Obba rivulosa TaxID=1052685 RepID=A0A8E2B2V9_9APHY|nr:hypothetical protein OBBRIDRAFT_610784 [Obba rivulosa]